VPDRKERDVVAAVRGELAAIEPPRACCRAAERQGLGRAALGQARSPLVARAAVRLGLEEASGRADPDAPDLATDEGWQRARSHCRASWLRGRFLGSGSLSLAHGGTHLEFVLPVPEAATLARRLSQAGLPASVRERRGRGVVTWKATERVLAFLRLCGASGSVLEIESRLVARHFQGHLNRILNAESANLHRSVASSARQLAAIERLEAEHALGRLPELERVVARQRQAAPEATLTEIAAGLGLARSRVQRAFERIEAASGRLEAASGRLEAAAGRIEASPRARSRAG
jgi:hypothetical protein